MVVLMVLVVLVVLVGEVETHTEVEKGYRVTGANCPHQRVAACWGGSVG